MRQVLPDLLGDERHEGMEQRKGAPKDLGKDGLDVRHVLLAAIVQGVLDNLDIPVAEAVPDELVNAVRCDSQLVLLNILRHRGDRPVVFRQDPLVRQGVEGRVGGLSFIPLQIHQHEPGCVPDLVAEIPDGFQSIGMEADIVSGGVPGDQHIPEGIGAELVDQHQRINPVPQGFAHLPALFVEDQSVDEDIVEGNVLHEVHPHEEHPGNPEENDVPSRHQHAGGIELLQFRGRLRPAQGREGPQGGAEPGVQHVRILLDVLRAAVAARVDVGGGADRLMTVPAVPDRNPVAPPELPGDAPVPDVLHPAEVDLGEAFRDEPGLTGIHLGYCGFGQRGHLDEPLFGNQGLDDRVAAVAAAYGMAVILHLHQLSQRRQVGNDGVPALVAVHAGVLTHFSGHPAFLVDDHDMLKVMAHGDIEVVGIVSRGDLYRSGPEFLLDIFVLDQGDPPPDDGQDQILPEVLGITFVTLGDGDGRIPKECLRPCGGDGDEIFGALHLVADVPEMTGLVAVFHLDVRDGGMAVGTPVDHVLTAVDQPLVEELLEDFLDGMGAAFVHGEPFPLPVAAAAQKPELGGDAFVIALLPVPDLLQEFLPAQVVSGKSVLFPDLFLHFGLCGNTGMVGAWDPDGVIALHPPEAHQDVLEGVVHGMAKVQLSGDVGGRHDDAEGLLVRIHFLMEPAAVFPIFIPFFLHCLGVVFCFHVHSSSIKKTRHPLRATDRGTTLIFALTL